MMGRHGLDCVATPGRDRDQLRRAARQPQRGVVMSPPNLPGWNDIPIVRNASKNEFGIRTAIHNDANACALAEWKFGAGVGHSATWCF